MQKLATRIFMIASLAFGVLGIAMVFIATGTGSEPAQWLVKAFMVSVFIILPSFAISVALKYLGSIK